MSYMDSAISLGVRGWKVFPCTENSKIPLKGFTSWESRATDNVDEIIEIWNETPNANIGLATGPSGLVVIDFDAAKSPQEASGIECFREAYPTRKLPPTYTVRTGSGGWHLYYRSPSVGLRNSASKLATRVDTRAQGGYVLAPGSSINGNKYEVTNNAPLADLPSWIVKELEDAPALRNDVKPKGDSTVYARKALESECKGIASMSPDSGRNHAINRAAWNMSRLVVTGDLDENLAITELQTAFQECGISLREGNNAIQSGLTRGKQHYGSS